MGADPHRVSGGALLAGALKAAGVKRVFALHGGHLDGFFKGCLDESIDLIDTRHEAAAGHAADAWARCTGEIGVCAITAGPGFTNGLTAIANAQLDSSPVLFIIGSSPLREIETNPLQGGIDQIAAARPLAKWAMTIPATERIPDLTAMAIRKAMTGRRGPVVLELPIDVLHSFVPDSEATQPCGVNLRPHPAPCAAEAARFNDLLAGARRPVVIAGMEAANTAAAASIRRFAEAHGVPVFYKTQAKGVLGVGHPLDGGAAGNLAVLPMLGVERPDLVILAGGKLGLLLGGRSGAIIPNDARLVQIHSDAGEIGRLRDVDLAIAGGCAEAFDTVLAAAAGPASDFSAWAAKAVSARDLFSGGWPQSTTEAGFIHPYHASLEVARAVGQSAVWTLDGGEAASWMGAVLEVDGPGRVLTHGYLGCLGIGMPFAIGAQIAHPDRRVIHVVGDGAMGFNMQELDTLARRNLPVVTVVMNNQVWGMSIHGQQIMYGANYSAISRLGMTRFADIGTAFGCPGERITRVEDIGPAMHRALASGKPAVVEIMTDPDVVHPVTTAMLGKAAEDAGEVTIPYYENLPAR